MSQNVHPAFEALLISTRNAHKADEIRAILGERVRVFTLQDLPRAPHIVEDAETFAGNATKKTLGLAQWLIESWRAGAESRFGPGTAVLADDSGLEVDALHGAPGVHSARFAVLDQVNTAPAAPTPANAPDAANNAKLLRLLEGIPAERRTARFRCVLAVSQVSAQLPLPPARLFDGACEGRIAFAPRGSKGFGYDPLFLPLGYEQSFAELGDAIKNRISHRAAALRRMQAWLEQTGGKLRLS
jgi:XTP/dITP diphosphohydrolase